jgi:hypothetical protein
MAATTQEQREDMEKQIIGAVIDGILERGGYTITLNDGEARPIKKSRDKAKLLEGVGSTDMDGFEVYDENGKYVGIVEFTYGNEGWTVIHDNDAAIEPMLEKASKLAKELEEKYG